MESKNQGERIDAIGFADLKLIQNPKGFCYGVDAVLLASFVSEKKGRRMVDLGTGTGIIPLVLSHKASPNEVIGIEVQKSVADMACRSVALNHLQDIIKIIHCDVKDAPKTIGYECFDVVVSNPPYMAKGNGLVNEEDGKMISRHETTATLEDFIQSAEQLLYPGGEFYLIHRPSRIVDILVLCRKYKLEPKQIQFIQPTLGTKPNIFMLQCRKGAKPELKYLDPLCVYDERGAYTKQILTIYEK